MIDLMKLEIQKSTLRTYIYASLIMTITMIGLLYLFAYAPLIEPNDPDMLIFASLNNIIGLYSAVNMAVFCILSCVMYSKLIVEEYKGKQLILLFSYPIHRKKILFAKISIVSLFTSLSMIVCNLIVFSVFCLTESFAPILAEPIAAASMLQALKMTLIMIFTAVSLSIIAAGIGLITKSVPSAIITGVILSSLFCNIAFNSLANETILWMVMIIALLAGAGITLVLMKHVNTLEVL